MKTPSLGQIVFMFFDTNEIHIQAFLWFIIGKLIIFQSSSPQNYFEYIYIYIYIQKLHTTNKF